MDERKCFFCGRPESVAVLDRHHVIRRSQGGTDNIVVDLCHDLCHEKATNNKEFEIKIQKLVLQQLLNAKREMEP